MPNLFIVGVSVSTLALTALAAVRANAQRRVADSLAISSPSGIDTGMFVTIGGTDQWLQIRGEDRGNPVLLVLHGGPGMSYVPLTPFFRSWERRFTVVQWDRRGAGKTYGKNGPERRTLNFDLLSDDGIEVTEYLRRELRVPKIVLVGHSVGSVVGVLMAKKRPDLFFAYVGTDQIADMKTNEAVSWQMLQDRGRTHPDEKTRRAIDSLEAPPYTDVNRWFEKQRLISATDPVAASFENKLFKMLPSTPNYSIADLMAFGKGLKYSAEALLPELMSFELPERAMEFDLPMFLFEGENDVLDPTRLAVAYFDSIRAPVKKTVIFAGAGHNAVLMHSDAFLDRLVEHVLPLTAKR